MTTICWSDSSFADINTPPSPGFSALCSVTWSDFGIVHPAVEIDDACFSSPYWYYLRPSLGSDRRPRKSNIRRNLGFPTTSCSRLSPTVHLKHPFPHWIWLRRGTNADFGSIRLPRPYFVWNGSVKINVDGISYPLLTIRSPHPSVNSARAPSFRNKNEEDGPILLFDAIAAGTYSVL